MGRRQRSSDGNRVESVSPIQYLLPISASPPRVIEGFNENVCGEVENAENVTEPDSEGQENGEPKLYRQAVPLLQPQSTSAARTIGKIVGDISITRRILQRKQPSGLKPHPNGVNSIRHVHFQKVCKDMFYNFDPVVKRTGRLPICRLRLLLHYYDLEVDDVLFRKWEQTLPGDCNEISALLFIQGCTIWFQEQFLIDHYAKWILKRESIGSAKVSPSHELTKCQSAPQLLQPFQVLSRYNDEAVAFSYADYAQSPLRQQKTQNEQSSTKSQAMISATQEHRRTTKMLTRLGSTSSIDTLPSVELTTSLPHDRLHEEKLARHILQRCGSQALAPSNRRKSSVSIASLSSSNQHLNPQTIKLSKLPDRKVARQQNAETAKAFSASIAMISRHVHNEELRDLREIAQEKQLAVVDERKQLRRLQSAHCKALAQEKAHQQIRDVISMKTLAQEESEFVRLFAQSREQSLRIQKPQFTLSSSTSTLFQQPPEILAAKATAKTGAQKKKLQMMEKEYLDHMRSIQLIEYAYERKRAIEDANEPKADASLLTLHMEKLPDSQEAALAAQELWQEILSKYHEDQDMTPLVPPPNSPPAALRFFSTTKLGGFLPPFTASTVTPSPITRVP